MGVGRSQLDEICLLLRFERLNSFALDDASVSACIQWDAACRVSSCATPATRSSSCLRLLSMKTNIHAEPRSGQQIQYRICPGSFVARQLHSQAQLYLHRCCHIVVTVSSIKLKYELEICLSTKIRKLSWQSTFLTQQAHYALVSHSLCPRLRHGPLHRLLRSWQRRLSRS